ncbi:hypothetical protein Tco_1227215 [Tanacetum coccineum]
MRTRHFDAHVRDYATTKRKFVTLHLLAEVEREGNTFDIILRTEGQHMSKPIVRFSQPERRLNGFMTTFQRGVNQEPVKNFRKSNSSNLEERIALATGQGRLTKIQKT